MDTENDEQSVKEFLHVARSPQAWLNSAQKLKKSADVIACEMARAFEENRAVNAAFEVWRQTRQGAKPHFCMEDFSLALSIGDVYFLLAGLCLENLLKGIIVHAHPEYVKDSGELGYSLKSHNLRDLVRDAGLETDLNQSEREMLLNASDAVVDWGRYHIPLKHSHYKRQHGWNDSQFVAFGSVYRRWAERLMRLFAKDTYGTCFPGDTFETRMTPDEYIRWQLDRKKPGEA